MRYCLNSSGTSLFQLKIKITQLPSGFRLNFSNFFDSLRIINEFFNLIILGGGGGEGLWATSSLAYSERYQVSVFTSWCSLIFAAAHMSCLTNTAQLLTAHQSTTNYHRLAIMQPDIRQKVGNLNNLNVGTFGITDHENYKRFSEWLERVSCW